MTSSTDMGAPARVELVVCDTKTARYSQSRGFHMGAAVLNGWKARTQTAQKLTTALLGERQCNVQQVRGIADCPVSELAARPAPFIHQESDMTGDRGC